MNLAEQVAQAARVDAKRGVDVDFVNAVAQRAGRRFDKGGEQYYDQISALHKSVRGSDADASLYWLVRMLDGGVDPRYLARRMIRMASEDIGLADPRALEVAINAAEIYERLAAFKDSAAPPSLEEVTEALREQQTPTSPWKGEAKAAFGRRS